MLNNVKNKVKVTEQKREQSDAKSLRQHEEHDVE